MMGTTTASTPVPGPASLWSSLKPALAAARVVLSYTVLILFALAMLLPFVFSIANSFKTRQDISSNPQSLLADPALGWTLDGYRQIMDTGTQSGFPRWILNSFVVAAASTVAHLVLDSMAGYALARIRFPGRGLAFALVIGTLMIPGIVLIVPRFLILKQLGLLNSYMGLIFPTLADAFGIFLMKQFFESIPPDIEEAAAIDGAGRFRMFFVIILPMALPALTALAIFGFQGSWNDFTGPLITVATEQSLWTLPLGLAFSRAGMGSALRFDILLAGAVLTTVPMAIIFFIFQRFFVEGVTYTAVKG